MKFIRKRNMVGHLYVTFCKMVASNAKFLAYLFMILSMINNAGIVSLIYPLIVFGLALMEETRPKKRIWDFILYYTVGLLVIKYIVQLSVMDDYVETIMIYSVSKQPSLPFHHSNFSLNLNAYCYYRTPSRLGSRGKNGPLT